MTSSSTDTKKRPGWVWAISIFLFLSAIWTLLSFYLVHSGSIPLTPEQRAYFDSLTGLDYGLAVLGSVLSLSSATALFLLRKAAVPLFGACLALNALGSAWSLVIKNGLEAAGLAGVIGALVGVAILAAIFLYTRRLSQRGVLT